MPNLFCFGRFDFGAGGLSLQHRSDALHLSFQNGYVNGVNTFSIIVCVCLCVFFGVRVRICAVQLFTLAEGNQAIYSSIQPSGL